MGTFYIQEDNSIGINLSEPTLKLVKQIMYFIKSNFAINKPIPSKVPPYFYINIPESNATLIDILKRIGCSPLQFSFKLNQIES